MSTASRSSYPPTSSTTATRPCCSTSPGPTRSGRRSTADPHVVLALTGDYTYVEAEWNAEPGTDPAYGVPTSYYTAVQLLCRAEVVDDPEEKAAILATQLDHFEPADSVRVTPTPANESDRRQLPGIRGLRLHLEGVRAKMKYGGNKPPSTAARSPTTSPSETDPMDSAARDHLLRRLD